MTVLLATDGSEDAQGAAQFLQALAWPAGSHLHLVSVVADPAVPIGPFGEPPLTNWEALQHILDAEREYATDSCRRADALLGREGVQITHAVATGDPAHEILAAAEAFKADLITLGSRGHTGLELFLLGSVARNVAKHARCPVLVAQAPQHGLRQVIVAVDGSEHANHAVDFAGRLPLPPGSEFVAAHVTRPYHPRPAILSTDPQGYHEVVIEVRQRHQEAAARLVEEARSRLAAARPATGVVREGDPTQELLALAASSRADLILAGARGASLIEGLLVGSVADRLLKAGQVSVLLVR